MEREGASRDHMWKLVFLNWQVKPSILVSSALSPEPCAAPLRGMVSSVWFPGGSWTKKGQELLLLGTYNHKWPGLCSRFLALNREGSEAPENGVGV